MIPKVQLKAFYQKVGRTVADWFEALECPDCKSESSLDWLLEVCSEGQPQLICRKCGKKFLIEGLKFKQRIAEDPLIELKHTLEKRRMINASIEKRKLDSPIKGGK
jgi:hypothetical protein